MRDQLDLKQLEKEANRQKLWSRFVTLIGFLVLILSVFSVFASSNSPSQMYARIGAKWQSIRDKAGGVCTIQTSPNGTTWLLTSNPLALSRWVSNEWEWYTPIEGEETSDICQMTLDEETIWVAFDRGIAHFDGQRWKIYIDVTPSKPVSIAANSLGVYVIDSRGNLARFDGYEWSTGNVRDTFPSLRSNADERYPSVVAASDTSLLVRWNGVWQFDGDRWQEITIGGRRLTPFVGIGTAHNRLWTIWYGDGILISSQLDGSDSKTYKINEIGLSSNDQIYQVGEYGNDTLFATDRGLIRFDGKSWTPLTILENQAIAVGQVSVHPNDNMWVITGNSGNISTIIIGFLGLTVAIILFFITIIVNSSRNITRLRAARQLLEPILPPQSVSKEPRNSNWLLIGVIIMFIVETYLAFSGQPELVDITTPIIFILLCIWVARRTLQYSGRDQKPLSKSTPIILFVGWVCVLWFGMRGIETINRSLVAPFFVVWIIVGFIPCATSIIRYVRRYSGDNAYQNASNDNAKGNLSGARKISLQFVKATTALNVGHLDEGETLARETVAQSQYFNVGILSASLNLLGLALMYQKHYEEAIPFIETAIRIQPTSLASLTSLAEVYLEAEVETERALEVIQFARQYGFENWLVHLMRKSSRPVTEGVHGWVLARLGRFEEADRAIQKAMKRISAKNKAGVAYLHYIKGKIEEVKGNQAQAAEWFAKAKAMDSGLYGQIAAQALSKLAPSQ
jgi:hypothetical protein